MLRFKGRENVIFRDQLPALNTFLAELNRDNKTIRFTGQFHTFSHLPLEDIVQRAFWRAAAALTARGVVQELCRIDQRRSR
jgi:hypothetical protein